MDKNLSICYKCEKCGLSFCINSPPWIVSPAAEPDGLKGAGGHGPRPLPVPPPPVADPERSERGEETWNINRHVRRPSFYDYFLQARRGGWPPWPPTDPLLTPSPTISLINSIIVHRPPAFVWSIQSWLLIIPMLVTPCWTIVFMISMLHMLHLFMSG